MAINTVRQYPLTKFYFSVDWGDGPMSFQEVTGLELSREIVEYRGGNDIPVKQCIPAMVSYGELTFKRGTFAGNTDFFRWWNGSTKNEPKDGMPEPKDITICLKNGPDNTAMVWEVTKALPMKLTSTDLNAENNEIAIETLVVRHEGITITAPGDVTN